MEKCLYPIKVSFLSQEELEHYRNLPMNYDELRGKEKYKNRRKPTNKEIGWNHRI